MSISTIASNVVRVLSDNAPAILSGVGVVGVGATAVLAARKAPDATLKIEKYRRELGEIKAALTEEPVDIDDVKVPLYDMVRLTWKDYALPVATGVGTILCIVLSHKINVKRGAAILGAYTVSERMYSQYKDKIEEVVGKEKSNKAVDDISKGNIASVSSQDVVVIETGNGDTLCFDSLSGRYFKSDMETIRSAQNDVNELIINEMHASHNDFYERIGLDDVELGNLLGWNLDNKMRLYFTSVLTRDNKPCLSINYDGLPVANYYKINA